MAEKKKTSAPRRKKRKTPQDNSDSQALKRVQEYSQELKLGYAARNRMFDAMEAMYLMEWDEKARVERQNENLRVTLSPDARNALVGAVRLLIATDPDFSVPYDKNESEARQASDKLEKAAKGIWQAAGRLAGNPVHYDLILSGLLFGEAHVAITATEDLLRQAKGGGKAVEARAERVARRAPYLFDVWDPRQGYPDFDNLGLRAFYRQVDLTAGEILDRYGDEARAVLDAADRFDLFTLNSFWDMENAVVWVEGKERPILQEAHGLPFIPVVATIAEGSRVFSKPEHQRQPFLYTLWKSGLWNRQNLMLTVFYYLMFGLGANPQYVFESANPEKEPQVDWSVPGGRIKLDASNNEKYYALVKNVIDPSILAGMQVAEAKLAESTIYRQALGEPLESASATYSLTALLAQAGRLPLVSPQRRLSWGIAEVMEIALRWLKHDGRSASTRYGGVAVELAPDEIPEHFEIEASLEIDLPQDKLQLAQVAAALSGGRDPLVSKQYVREHVLGIGQSSEMTRQIWREQAGQMHYADFVRGQMQAARQPQPPPPAPDPRALQAALASGRIRPEQVPPEVLARLRAMQGKGPAAPNASQGPAAGNAPPPGEGAPAAPPAPPAPGQAAAQPQEV